MSVASKKPVEARKVGEPCPDGCFDKVDREQIDQIFVSFWAIRNYDGQNAYLQSLIKEKAVIRKFVKTEATQPKGQYFIPMV